MRATGKSNDVDLSPDPNEDRPVVLTPPTTYLHRPGGGPGLFPLDVSRTIQYRLWRPSGCRLIPVHTHRNGGTPCSSWLGLWNLVGRTTRRPGHGKNRLQNASMRPCQLGIHAVIMTFRGRCTLQINAMHCQ